MAKLQPVERPNTSPEVSPEEIRARLRQMPPWEGIKRWVKEGVVTLVAGVIGAQLWPTANPYVSYVGAFLILGCVVVAVTEFRLWNQTERDILRERINNANAARESAEGSLARYEATDPRLEITDVKADELNPYRIAVSVAVENPGEPTILRSWGLSVTGSAGEKVPGRLASPDSWICRSIEPTKDGSSPVVDNADTPIRKGGTAKATLLFDFAESLFALRLDELACYTVSCRTINQIPVQRAIKGAPRAVDPYPLVETTTIDRILDLPPGATRTNRNRLEAARTLFDQLVGQGVAVGTVARSRLAAIAHYLVLLSLDSHGIATAEYVRDYDHVRKGRVLGGLTNDG